MSSSLPMVEVLLYEFYQSTTPNERKRDIESQLLSFKSQPNAWQICLEVATCIEGNQFLWFFATSTLEHTLTRRWNHLTAPDRVVLRETLWRTYVNLEPTKVPKRQRDTFAQLISIMGKREFPDTHSLFIAHCLELVKTKFILGICLLRTISEEVTSSREDVSTDRKNYFHSSVSMCVPDILDLLTKYLIIAVCHINDKDIDSLPNSVMDYNLLSSLQKDNQLSFSAFELLQCLQHLVTWIRTDLISDYFLLSILDLAAWRPNHEQLSLAAVSVLNELFYLQKILPCSAIIMHGINGLLEQHNSVKQQSEIYGDKFRECLRLYASKYWSKLSQEHNLLEAFLKSLFYCTSQKNGSLDFTEKLEIWIPIIKGLVSNFKFYCYTNIFIELVSETMKRMLFEHNKTELELLDNEVIDDHSQTTEWHQYLTQCIEFVALIAETHPDKVFIEIYRHWSRPHFILLSIELAIDSGRYEDAIQKLKCDKFSETLKDFSTVCQTILRIIPSLNSSSSSDPLQSLKHLQTLMDNFIKILSFFVSNKILSLNVDRSLFQIDFDYLYSQILIAIKNILMILPPNVKNENLFINLFEFLGTIFLDTTANSSPIIYLAASELMLCMLCVIRPRCLMGTSAIINLIQIGPRLLHLPKQVISNIYISLIGYLVLPWKNVEDQEYDRRTIALKDYIVSLARNFLDLDLSFDESKISAVTSNLLDSLSLVVDFFKDSNNNVKQILASILEPIITKALVCYNNFGANNNSIATTVADFSLSILRSLQNQLGASFIKEIVHLFVTVSSGEHLICSRIAVIEKILIMFQLIVEQPGNTSMAMLPLILDFSIDHILPLLNQESHFVQNSELSSHIYSLFDSVLSCKWQYFYKPHVQQNGILASSTDAFNCENLHPAHFMAIMNAYGQILVTGSDPSIIRSVLFSMQQVNDRGRLYQKSLFKDYLLSSFQKAVINLLISGEGNLHYELLATTLYSLGEADMMKLKESFIDLLSVANIKTIDDTCMLTDIPTFTEKLSQLMRDVHYIQMSQHS